MIRIIPLAVAIFLSGTLFAQIKINSPYKKEKDKTYIPGGDEKAPTPKDRKAPRSSTNRTSQPTTNPGANTSSFEEDEMAITNVVKGLLNAMNMSDMNKVKSLFSPQGRLISIDENGKMNDLTVQEFAKMIGESKRGSLREEIKDMDVKIDDRLATAWVEYDFFYNGSFNHCGVDAFQLYKSGSTWRITQISDTKRADCSKGGKAAVIHQTMDAWHAAASRADINAYFSRFGNDGVFLGTDPGENWSKDEFYRFAKPFFDKGKVWDFKATERNVYFNEDGDISWFNELLDTWMGKCRGSGVMRKTDGGKWELAQYNLAILIPNDVVQDYLKLIQK